MGETRIRVWHAGDNALGWAVHTWDHEYYMVDWDDGSIDSPGVLWRLVEFEPGDYDPFEEVVRIKEVTGL